MSDVNYKNIISKYRVFIFVALILVCAIVLSHSTSAICVAQCAGADPNTDSEFTCSGSTLVENIYSYYTCTSVYNRKFCRVAQSIDCSATGQTCDAANGICSGYACTPSCAGKTCGYDGCSGSCGVCSSGYACVNFACVVDTVEGATYCSDSQTLVRPKCIYKYGAPPDYTAYCDPQPPQIISCVDSNPCTTDYCSGGMCYHIDNGALVCGVCGGSTASNLGCGWTDGSHCFANPGPNSCGSCSGVVDLGCGCGNPGPNSCGSCSGVVDLGCGCGNPGPNSCGSCSGVVNLGCGCGNPAPNSCGSCSGVVNLGCGCGNPAPVCGVCGGSLATNLGCGWTDGSHCSANSAPVCGVCGGSLATNLGCGWTDGSHCSANSAPVCGVCGGSLATNLGCGWTDGSHCSANSAPVCGVCGGSTVSNLGCGWTDGSHCSANSAPVCGVCGGSLATNLGCGWTDGSHCTANPGLVCGVCGGSTVSNLGCGWVDSSHCVANSAPVCGVCGGSLATNLGCGWTDGSHCSAKPAPVCGVCGGSTASNLGCGWTDGSHCTAKPTFSGSCSCPLGGTPGTFNVCTGACDGQSCNACDPKYNTQGPSCGDCDGNPGTYDCLGTLVGRSCTGHQNNACGVCNGPVSVIGASCNDGSVCTIGEHYTDACGTCGGSTTLNCDDGKICTVDSCNPISGCVYTPGNVGTVCHASAGICDPAETCNGAADCPPDFILPSGVCRPSAGPCDAPESCNGVAACPVDSKLATGTVCRLSVGSCDTSESCTGSSNSCPSDVLISAGVVCGSGAGVCGSNSVCSGVSGVCPSNGNKPDGTSCADANLCNGMETCQSGVCAAGTPISCGVTSCPGVHSSGSCSNVCDIATGACSACTPVCSCDLGWYNCDGDWSNGCEKNSACGVTWQGLLLNGSDPLHNHITTHGSVVVDGASYDVPVGSGLISIPNVVFGNHVVVASADGFDFNTTNINVNVVAPAVFFANISLSPPVCHSDCSFDGRCEYSNCGGINGCTPPVDTSIFNACIGKVAGTRAKLLNGTYIDCCSGNILNNIDAPFSMSTCSQQVFPMARQVVLEGRIYTLVTASYKNCEN